MKKQSSCPECRQPCTLRSIDKSELQSKPADTNEEHADAEVIVIDSSEDDEPKPQRRRRARKTKSKKSKKRKSRRKPLASTENVATTPKPLSKSSVFQVSPFHGSRFVPDGAPSAISMDSAFTLPASPGPEVSLGVQKQQSVRQELSRVEERMRRFERMLSSKSESASPPSSSPMLDSAAASAASASSAPKQPTPIKRRLRPRRSCRRD